jgi:hypothetical protein
MACWQRGRGASRAGDLRGQRRASWLASWPAGAGGRSLPGNSRPGPSVEGGSGGMACWQRGRGGSQAGALAGADAGPVGWPPGLRSRGGICPFDGGTDMGAFSTRQLARYLDRGPARWVGARASRQGQPANRQLWSGVAFPGRGFRGGCFGQSHTRLGSPFKGPCRREGPTGRG